MATKTKTDARDHVVRVLRDYGATADEQLLTDVETNALIEQAVRRYSVDRPRTVADDVTADGSMTTALPGAWEEDFSVLLAIEYPIAETPPSIVDPRDYSLYVEPSGETIRWRLNRPANGDTVRLTFTVPRVLDDQAANTTVPDADFYAVCDLATSIAADAIANKYARTHEPILNADVTDYRTKAQEWGAIARRFEQRYRDALRISKVGRPASRFLNWDNRSGTRHDFLFHRSTVR